MNCSPVLANDVHLLNHSSFLAHTLLFLGILIGAVIILATATFIYCEHDRR